MKNYDKVTDNLDIATKEIAGKVNVSNASTAQNNSYKLLLSDKSGGGTGDVGVIQDSGLAYNPKTSILYANTLKDGSGNVITSTYATKSENATKTDNDLGVDVQELVIKLPVAMYSMTSAIKDNYVYLFGGYTGLYRSNKIYKFDTINNTIETLSASLPVVMSDSTSVIKDNNIYLFGGYTANSPSNKIYKFDTINNTIETLSASLPYATSALTSAIKDNYVYLFGGYDSLRSNKIYKFDTTTEENPVLVATLPYATDYMTSAIKDNYVYLFGGYDSSRSNKIYKFDTTTEENPVLVATLPYAITGMTSVIKDNFVYLFGGYTGLYRSNKIYKFDTINNTITELLTTLPVGMSRISSVIKDNYVYLFSGYDGSKYSDKIYKTQIMDDMKDTLVGLDKVTEELKDGLSNGTIAAYPKTFSDTVSWSTDNPNSNTINLSGSDKYSEWQSAIMDISVVNGTAIANCQLYIPTAYITSGNTYTTNNLYLTAQSGQSFSTLGCVFTITHSKSTLETLTISVNGATYFKLVKIYRA